MKKIFIVFLLFYSMNKAYTQTTTEFFITANTFFNNYVKHGKINYKAIKNNQKDLEVLSKMITNVSVLKENTTEYQAFWINTYNLLVIEGIVNNYPIRSPIDKAGFFDKIIYNAAGKTTTPNDIENKILRAEFPEEARFHFVLVCAGLGCPPIINEAYTPSKLETQITTQTVKALNDPNFIQVDNKKVKISQLFDWYKGDFVQDGKSLADYINLYREEKLPENAKISFYTSGL